MFAMMAEKVLKVPNFCAPMEHFSGKFAKFDLHQMFFTGVFYLFFSQKLFTCDHWYNVDCNEATHYYRLNADPDTNPYTKDQKKKAYEDHY